MSQNTELVTLLDVKFGEELARSGQVTLVTRRTANGQPGEKRKIGRKRGF